jgi:hypothetical protein
MSTTQTSRPAPALGPTLQVTINNLVQRVKRVAFGTRRFRNYRLRALLYAGQPNWTLLDTLSPP